MRATDCGKGKSFGGQPLAVFTGSFVLKSGGAIDTRTMAAVATDLAGFDGAIELAAQRSRQRGQHFVHFAADQYAVALGGAMHERGARQSIAINLLFEYEIFGNLAAAAGVP